MLGAHAPKVRLKPQDFKRVDTRRRRSIGKASHGDRRPCRSPPVGFRRAEEHSPEIVRETQQGDNAGLAASKGLADLARALLPGFPAEFGKLIGDEIEKWARVASSPAPSRSDPARAGYSMTFGSRTRPLSPRDQKPMAIAIPLSQLSPAADKA